MGSAQRRCSWRYGRDLCGYAAVDYRRPSRRATISPVARGCSAVGSASPCQGEGRGFESRHPLEVQSHQPQRWSGRVVRQRPAKPCTRVRFPSPPPWFLGAISSAGERFPDTEEVTGSIPVSRTRFYLRIQSFVGWPCNKRATADSTYLKGTPLCLSPNTSSPMSRYPPARRAPTPGNPMNRSRPESSKGPAGRSPITG
jgi:hypothetical protein